MDSRYILIFGFNEYGLEIARNVLHKCNNIIVFSLHDDNLGVFDDFKVEKFDLSDNWDEIDDKYDIANSIVFTCVNDEAENIFLTISLRSAFKDTRIIALAKNNEDAAKLKMAGASKVIPIVETTANIITDMLKKPIISEVMHDILYEESKLKIEQIHVENIECFNGEYPADIQWSRDHGVIVLSIVRKDMSSDFIYSSKAKHNHVEKGDILVAVGYEKDLEEFKKLAGSKK